MATSLAILLVGLISSAYCSIIPETAEPEAHMSVKEIIEYHGYPVEEHEATTKDGYVITIQRIPYGSSGQGDGSPRKPVLIMHGLFCSSAVWVTNTKDKNLPYLLANAGYDVWLGNVRGTLYGRKHLTLTPDNKEFWNFSFDEMAKYDAPAIIDKILKVTGYKKLLYIGHSMGSTIAFSMLATQADYNDKVVGVLAMSPVATVGHIKSPLKILAPLLEHTSILNTMFGSGELNVNNDVIKMLSTKVCASPVRLVCSSLIFIACGFDLAQMNMTRLPVILQHTPAATSVQNLLHYIQMIGSNRFQTYDYGSVENLEKYGQDKPKVYDVSKITSPVALFWSDNDYLADPTDVSRLAQNLPSLVLKYRVSDDKFSHLDFMWAIDSKTLVYDKVIATMKKLWKK